MKILLLNGPPRSGKDTLGRLIVSAHLNTGNAARVFKFAHELKLATHRLYDIDDHGDGELFDSVKDQPHPLFRGVSPRAAYNAVSERLMKHLHGPRVFGEMLALSLRFWGASSLGVQVFGALAVVTDSGFNPEAEVLVERVGARRVRLVRLHRPGCDFSGDSRGWIELPGVKTLDVHNDGTAEDLERTAEQLRAWAVGS